jgi:isoaspartyl peptidase/L-asparaginase-like protein (Ntn-hydrolase superfamily)
MYFKFRIPASLTQSQYYIRHATASTIMNRMKFLHQSVDKASKVCLEELEEDGAKGGIILLDSNGNCKSRSLFYFAQF